METKAILEADLAALTRKLFDGPDDLFAKLPSDQLARLRGSALVAQRHYAEAGLAKLLGAATADGGTPGSAEIDRTATRSVTPSGAKPPKRRLGSARKS